MRTSGLAVSAADAVHTVGIFPNRNIELADFLTGSAFRAFFRVDFKSIERDFVENSINRSERANVTAKRTVYYNRRKNRERKDGEFPAEEKSSGPPHGIVQKNEGNSAFKRSNRANPLAEPRLAKACDVNHEHRKQNHKNAEEKEPEIAQAFFTGQTADFFGEWNLKKQILNQPERTEKTAHEPAEQRSENNKKSHNVH